MNAVRDALAAKALFDRVRELFVVAQQPAEHPSQATRRDLQVKLSLDDLEDELKQRFQQMRQGRA